MTIEATVTHERTTEHDMFIGYFCRCSCGWLGASRPTRGLAEQLFTIHVRNAR